MERGSTVSAAKHTPGPRARGGSANQTIASAMRGDARVRKELHLTPVQLQYLQTAEGGAVKDWAAPSNATLQSLLRRGLLESRERGHVSKDSTRFLYITAAGLQAIDIARRAAIAKATGSAL